ncbi:MAG TPA: M1 family aminopeptidase, partial [Flavisolibacter sp.]|nr:M1 family aminopeptidase [Flavisolibacter sp.]
VDYPWAKYAQIVGRDYVSGAMENTTATLHQESAQQDARELTDGNGWENTIAHELFHQWFGDYVTAESWSNITLNESFATIGSQLWNEFGHSRDAGYAERYSSAQGYLNSGSEKKDLVRFNYNDKEDVFDAVSYNKGGAILQMLRNYVGDSAFFKALNLYLTTNKFKSAEAQQLRLAFEEVTGKDLNWFWNQWYYGAGHPKLNINYTYNEATKQVQLIVEQTQADKVFQLPVKVDVWNGTMPMRYTVWVKNKVDTFNLSAPQKPDLVNFDADKVLLAQKTESKSLEEYMFQYKHAGNYIDRREAIDAALKKQAEAPAAQLLVLALKDSYGPLRSYTAGKLDMTKEQIKNLVEPTLYEMAQKDTYRPAKAAAIDRLGAYRFAKYAGLFKAAINDSSYSVAGSALEALSKVDSVTAYSEARRLSTMPAKGRLNSAITKTMIRFGDESSAETILKNFEDMPLGQPKFEAIQPLVQFLGGVKNTATFKRGVDDIYAFIKEVPENFRDQVVGFVENMLTPVVKEKTEEGLKEQADYLQSKMSKKGF